MEERRERLTKNNQSAEKTLSIIEEMSNYREPVRVQDLAKKLSMSPSTLVRFLATLIKCGYVAQDPDSLKYYLTLKICNISGKISANNQLRDVARPFLKALSFVFNESVCLAIEQDKTVIYIDVIQGPDQMLRTMQRIGSAAPMHCTGVGKLMLLNYTDKEIDEIINAKGLHGFTSNTITTKKALIAELSKIRSQGYAFDNEECEVGARCVAVPIRDYTGQIVGCASVTGPIFRMTDNVISQNIAYLKETAEKISKKLGYE